jgi:alkylation response protein AidB-like acyl-CoA dehydrogenase
MQLVNSSLSRGQQIVNVAKIKTRNAIATSVPADDVETVLQALKSHEDGIKARSQALDEHQAFPEADVQVLRDIGALKVFGTDAPKPLDLMQALRLVGRANLSLGRIFEGHVNGARLVDWYGDGAQRQNLLNDLADGQLFGVWNTEPEPGVKIETSDREPRLQGCKSYATGAGFVNRAVVTATDQNGRRQMVIADGADPSRADLSAWRVRGMRATCSGLYDLTGLPFNRVTALGAPGDYTREPRFSAGAWRFTAVQLGGVERVLMLLRDHLAAGPDVAPMAAARFADALAAARSAYLWVRESAVRAESPDAGPDEIAFVLMTRGVVEKAGLEVMEAAARTVGTRAFFQDHPLDRACRDLALYLRQPAPDQARDRAAKAFIARDCWSDDRLW